MSPLPNGSNGSSGRDCLGRFQKGNAGGPGNPLARKASQLRSMLMRSVTASELRNVVKALVQAAIAGDVQAARVLLDRVLGPPTPLDYEERLAALEQVARDRLQSQE